MSAQAVVASDGTVRVVHGTITLNNDGSMTLDLPGAAQWCEFHSKGLKIVLANPQGDCEPDVVYAPAGDLVDASEQTIKNKPCVHKWEEVGGVNGNFRVYFNGVNAYIRCEKCGKRKQA